MDDPNGARSEETAPSGGRPNALARLLGRIDGFQRRHRWAALPLAVNKRFGEHEGTRLAATVSYYSFFSVFPLLLVFVTVLGLVLEDDSQLRQDLVDGALGQIPVLGQELAGNNPLQGSVLALVIGLATATWAGMGAAGALQLGLEDVGDVPFYERGNFAFKRLRMILFLVAVAAGIAASVLLTNLARLFDVGPLAGALGLVATVAVNVVLTLAMMTVLPARRRPVRELLPGAVVAGVLLAALQLLGSFIVARFVRGASDTYGTFAIVIGGLSWFHLVSRILLLSAQLNEVLALDLWPRRLVGDTAMTEGDRRAMLLDVQRVQRDKAVGYAVSLNGAVASSEEPLGERTP
ncbi:MAG: YihY/virulence factor BrkB family protein [Ilumatobacteraceae bacterium]